MGVFTVRVRWACVSRSAGKVPKARRDRGHCRQVPCRQVAVDIQPGGVSLAACLVRSGGPVWGDVNPGTGVSVLCSLGGVVTLLGSSYSDVPVDVYNCLCNCPGFVPVVQHRCRCFRSLWGVNGKLASIAVGSVNVGKEGRLAEWGYCIIAPRAYSPMRFRVVPNGVAKVADVAVCCPVVNSNFFSCPLGWGCVWPRSLVVPSQWEGSLGV